MAMTAKLWSIGALALELGRSERMIGKALEAVPADGVVRGHPAWLMKTALPALVRYEDASDQLAGGRPGRPRLPKLTGGGTGNGSAVPVRDPDLDRIEALNSEISAGMAALRAAAPADRLKVVQGFGKRIGELDRLLERTATKQGADFAMLTEPFRDDVVGRFVREVRELLSETGADAAAV